MNYDENFCYHDLKVVRKSWHIMVSYDYCVPPTLNQDQGYENSRKSKSLPALCNGLLSQEVEQKICCNIICFPSDEE